MVKRIAILTLYYKNPNYGGVLQAYALQNVLSKMGYDAQQISYVLESGYEKSAVQRAIHDLLAEVYHLLKYRGWILSFHKCRRQIYSFAGTIPHTKRVTKKTISKLAPYFDLFVSGSDQIWNPVGWQPTLFFDFLPKNTPRMSYAASIARDDLTEEQLNYMDRYLNRFEAISVREAVSADILNGHCDDYNVQVMPDPVLLVTKKEWETLLTKDIVTKDYIFAYFLGNDVEQREAALEYAKRHNKKIWFVSHLDWNNYLWEKSHAEYLVPELGVKQFITMIRNADFVITNSFHCTVFSAIFETPFVVLSRYKQGDKKSMNSRVVTFLQEIGVSERLKEKLLDEHIFNLSTEEIMKMRNNIARLRKKGYNYLVENIKRI